MSTVRIWDLPTRLFHWLLAASVVALVVTAKVGGNAMVWHFRLGYVVLALLAFRLVWGLVGGRWSRFASFVPTPGRLWRYLRGSSAEAESAGHSPLGALSGSGQEAEFIRSLTPEDKEMLNAAMRLYHRKLPYKPKK